MRLAGVANAAAWRWQERFTLAWFDGQLREKTHPSRIYSLAREVAERMAALTQVGSPGEPPLDQRSDGPRLDANKVPSPS